MPHLYSLTNLTGARRNDDRRAVMFTVEVRRYTLIVIGASLVVSVIPSFLVGLIIGMIAPHMSALALLVPMVFVFAGLILWDSRQRSGLRLRNYQAILDKRKAQNGVLYAAGSQIPKPQLVMHQQVVIPARPAAAEPVLSRSKKVGSSLRRHGRRRQVRAEGLLT